MESSGTPPDEIDLLVVATSTNPNLMPSLVQASLLADHAMALEINVVCSGFAHAFEMAFRWQQTTGGKVLVIGADLRIAIIQPVRSLDGGLFG